MPRTKRVTDGMTTRKRGEKRKRESAPIIQSEGQPEVTEVRSEPSVQQEAPSACSVQVGQGGGDREDLGMCSMSDSLHTLGANGVKFTSSIISYNNSLGLNVSQEL